MSSEGQNEVSAAPAPETPINVKRQQIRQHFMSPTDNLFSPCTAKLMGNKTKGIKPRGLLHQTFQKNMQQPPASGKENVVEPECTEKPSC